MRILIVGGYAPSLLNFRGPLLARLVSLGHEVVAAAPDPDESVIEGLDALGVRYQSFPLARAGLNPLQDLRTLLALRRLIKSYRPDLILAYTAKPVIYSGLAGRLLRGGPKRFALITGLGYGFGQGGTRQRLIGRLVRGLYRRALEDATGVIFQNPDDQKVFAESRVLLPSVANVVVDGSGVSLDRYRPRPLPDGPVFLLIARLLAEKGIREFAAAARQLKQKYPESRFLLVGPLDPNPGGIEGREVEAWHASGAIDYLGSLDDVRPAIAQCRVYVLPSYYREGTPRTILEAMAMGRPIITADSPGCRETVRSGRNGLLVKPRDIDSLTLAMERFIQAPELAVTMGQASLDEARARYDVDKVNQAMLEFMGLGSEAN